MGYRLMIVIYGSTGVGKSDFALEIAGLIPAEIINMDSGQIYVPLSVGTAKPDLQAQPIPHHLFDIMDKPHNYTVVEYRSAVLSLIEQIKARNRLPILVGGSGFYLKSLFFPPTLRFGVTGPPSAVATTLRQAQDSQRDEPAQDYAVASQRDESLNEKKDQVLYAWDQLHEIDPDRALEIQPNDTYRIQRALEIWLSTGVKPSLYKPQYENPFGDYHIYYLTRDTEDLYTRINQRVEQMFKAGWLEEVTSLMGSEWIPFIEKKKLIGYNEIVHYIRDNDSDYDTMISRIKKRTRTYARKQNMFWRMLAAQIDEHCYTAINLTTSSHDIYLKQLTDHAMIIKGCLV